MNMIRASGNSRYRGRRESREIGPLPRNLLNPVKFEEIHKKSIDNYFCCSKLQDFLFLFNNEVLNNELFKRVLAIYSSVIYCAIGRHEPFSIFFEICFGIPILRFPQSVSQFYRY